MLNQIKNLKSQRGFLRYLKNTSWLIGDKVVRILVALTIGVWVTRYLGPEDFGILSFSQSFVGIFEALSTLGLGSILMRELIRSSQSHDKLLGTSFLLQTCGSCLIMIILITSIYLNDNDRLTNTIIIIMGMVTFIRSFGVIGTFFLSQVKGKINVIPSFISLIISSLLKVYFILAGYPLIYFAVLIFIDVLIIILLQIYFYYQIGYSIFKWRFSIVTAKNLLKDSWPLVLSGIVISVYMKIDQVMIKEILDSASVGQYAAAVRLSEAWYFIPMVTCTSLFPAIVNAKTSNEKLYNSRLQNLFDLMMVMAFIVILPVSFLSEWIVHFLYGNEFPMTASVLSIHIWAGIFVFLGVANNNWFISENLQSYNILCLGMGLIVNVILNLIWIPLYGISGAAFATLISQFVASILAPVFFKKTRPSFYKMIKSLLFISLAKRIIHK